MNFKDELDIVYGSKVNFDNELNWLKTWGASADEHSLGDAWREVLTNKGLWNGDPIDSYIDWLQLATGLSSRDTDALLREMFSSNRYKLGYLFNGTNAYVTCDYMDSDIQGASSTLDIKLNIKPTGFTGSSGMFLGLNDGGGNVFTLNIDTTTKKFRFFAGSDSSTTVGTIVATANTNYKIRFTYDYTTYACKLWVNDVLDVSATKNLNTVISGCDQISLGQEFDGGAPSDFFQGNIILQSFLADDVELYDYTQDTLVNAS